MNLKLLAWYLYDQTESETSVPTPPDIYDWLREFAGLSDAGRVALIDRLASSYREFRRSDFAPSFAVLKSNSAGHCWEVSSHATHAEAEAAAASVSGCVHIECRWPR